MKTKAKQPRAAAALHTRGCSHLHVPVPTVARTPNVATAESCSTQGGSIPADSSPAVGPCRLPRCRTRSRIVLCLQSPGD